MTDKLKPLKINEGRDPESQFPYESLEDVSKFIVRILEMEGIPVNDEKVKRISRLVLEAEEITNTIDIPCTEEEFAKSIVNIRYVLNKKRARVEEKIPSKILLDITGRYVHRSNKPIVIGDKAYFKYRADNNDAKLQLTQFIRQDGKQSGWIESEKGKEFTHDEILELFIQIELSGK